MSASKELVVAGESIFLTMTFFVSNSFSKSWFNKASVFVNSDEDGVSLKLEPVLKLIIMFYIHIF